METFLQVVAKDLYSKLGSDLSRVVIVFPNKRAGLFFSEYLASQTDHPIWSPAYISISELFRQLSGLQPGDPIKLICELYQIFREETQSDESLDDFYFWGELLISDFDDVDKNLVDAGKLFTNLQELKNIMDGYDFITEEQEEAIRVFFQNFSVEKRTDLKEKFISLWNRLGTIYTRFNKRLRELGISYEGMLYRDALEQLEPDNLTYDKYVFVGFNVLNEVEIKLFRSILTAEKAMFYWDYDHFYTQATEYKHEAGEFINRNLSLFPSELPHEYFDNLNKPKKIRFVSSPTENAQARYIPDWINSVESVSERENAIVLCNESLLLPVLHSIPSAVKHINITMGFPLAQTPVYSFINAAIELQTVGYSSRSRRYMYALVLPLLKHPYTRRLSQQAGEVERDITANNRFYPSYGEIAKDDFLTLLFTPRNGIRELCEYINELIREVAAIYQHGNKENDIFDQLYRESLFKSYTVVNRMRKLVEEGLDVQADTFKRLLNKILTGTNIPFHGEPAIGMQIMGVLETRNLDFKNLIMLSLNEGQLPKTGKESSFIPYNLRKAFGMTTIEHQIAVYAYYFYRLIQRAEDVTLVYNTSSDGLNRGEWSRFMLQFLLEWPFEVEREFLEAGQSPQERKEIVVEKTPAIRELMVNYYDTKRNPEARFSPSAMNTYLDCRLKFYYHYVSQLKTSSEVNDEIDSSKFGSIFHRAAELAYRELTTNGTVVRKEDIERLLKQTARIQGFVDRAFKEIFFHVSPTEKPEYNGIQLINSKVITSYLKQLLRNDAHYAPFELMGMEARVGEVIPVKSEGETLSVRIGGTVDRMDCKDGILRVVDYKTGGNPKTITGIPQLFEPADDRPGHVFQTFLYASILTRQQSNQVAPSLLYIHRAASEDYSPLIEIGEPRKPKEPVVDFSKYDGEFRGKLRELLEEIFHPDVPFTQTEQIKKCQYCDFRTICRR